MIWSLEGEALILALMLQGIGKFQRCPHFQDRVRNGKEELFKEDMGLRKNSEKKSWGKGCQR